MCWSSFGSPPAPSAGSLTVGIKVEFKCLGLLGIKKLVLVSSLTWGQCSSRSQWKEAAQGPALWIGRVVWAPQHGSDLFPSIFSPHRTSNKLCCRELPRYPQVLLWAALGSVRLPVEPHLCPQTGTASFSLLVPAALHLQLTTAHCDYQSKQPLPSTEHPPPAQKTDGFSFTEAQGSLSPAHRHTDITASTVYMRNCEEITL